MRLPRDWSGDDLIKRLGYEPTRQGGSHVCLTRHTETGEHHITVPLHKALRVGILNGIVTDVANHLKVSKDDLLKKIL